MIFCNASSIANVVYTSVGCGAFLSCGVEKGYGGAGVVALYQIVAIPCANVVGLTADVVVRKSASVCAIVRLGAGVAKEK